MTHSTDTERAALLPCPFCGGAASAHEVDPRGAPGWFHLTVRHRDGCLHRPSKEILLLNTDDLERWNRRAPAAPVQLPAGLEPVAWMHVNRLGASQAFTSEPPPGFKAQCAPLYTEPQVRALLASARAVPPQGWQMVPVEPTDAMYQRVFDEGYYHDNPAIAKAVLRSEYLNMLAAAPKEPAP